MIRYDDIKNRGYDTLETDYNSQYAQGDNCYFSDPKLVQDTKLLQHVTLSSLGFSKANVQNELMGIKQSLINPVNNKPYPDSVYNLCIEEAVSWVEEYLDIVIRPRVVHEVDDYNKTDYMNYGYIRTDARPIIQLDDARLIWNNATVMRVPRSWFRINHRFGNYRLNPTAIFAQTSGGILQSPTLLSFSGNFQGGFPFGNDQFMPGMIGTSYVAGMLPRDPRDKGIQRYYYAPGTLIAVVNKLAAVYILERWGRNVVGAGIAGYGVSIDSISSHVETTESPENTASTSEINLLMTDIKNNLKVLKSYYGLNLGIIS